MLRPPFAQERLCLRDDGRVELHLKTPWRDGTRHLVFDPLLACPSCGGRMRLIATIHDPTIIRRILEHLRACPSGANAGPGPPSHTLVTR